MIVASLPGNERERIRALRRYRVVDTAPEESFDRLCRVAARAFRASAATIGLIDEHREWFKAAHGCSLAERDRAGSFGAHAIAGEGPLVVLNARQDSRFHNNLAVVGPPHVAFCAAAPLITPEGLRIGALSVFDPVPRAEFTDEQCRLLLDLAAAVMDLLEPRRSDEPRYRRLVETSPDAIFLHDGNSIVYANPSAARMFGGDPRRRHPLSLVDPDYVEAARTRVAEALKGAEPPPTDTRLLRLDGSAIDVEEALARVSPGLVQWVVRDVAERKLRETAQSLAHLGWWKRDLATGEVQCSEETYRIFGLPVGSPDIQAVLGGRAHSDEGNRAGPRRITRPDGEIRTILERVHVQHDAADVLLGTVQDITEIKRLEERLWQAQKMEAVGRLAGGIAHDFNNLLTVIMGYCQLLLVHLTGDVQFREYGDEILRAAQRASVLTGQLLAFSRGKATRSSAMEMNAVVQGMDEMLRRIIGEDVELSVRLTASPGIVEADPFQVEQMLLNLSINAREAMPAGGELIVATGNAAIEPDSALQFDTQLPPGRYVRLAVTDTGCGMPPEVQARAFDPFFTTKDRTRSTGLGLSAVYGIVTQSGGGVRLSSQPGKGSTFEIYLPEVPGQPAEVAAAPKPERAAASEVVLLVEDDPLVRSLAARILRGAGYHVLEASGFAEAVSQARAFPETIHLMLTDVVMPDARGPQLVDAIRSLRPATRFLYMSGYVDAGLDQERLLRDRAGFLRKPFDSDTLLAAVHNALGWQARSADVLIADDERAVRSAFRAILEDAGYRITEAGNGKEALDLFRQSRFDLLITDIAMPGQAGLETIHALRSSGVECAIIAVSGAFGGSLLEFATRLGAERVLQKPVTREVLLDAVAAVLDGAGRAPQPD